MTPEIAKFAPLLLIVPLALEKEKFVEVGVIFASVVRSVALLITKALA